MALMSSRALGKLAHSCCVGCEGAVASKRSTAYKGPWCSFCLHGNQHSSAKLRTKGSSFPKVRTFWNHFLTIKQEKTFKSPFCDHTPPCCWFLHNLGVGKLRGDGWPPLYSEDLSFLKGSFMPRPAPY